MFDHEFGHLCGGRRIHFSGLSDFGILSNLGTSSILTCVFADIGSAACPAHCGSLCNDIHSFRCRHFVTQKNLVQ